MEQTEKDRFLERVRKRENGCWEFVRADGSSYEDRSSPTWGKRGEAIRHAAVRLLGGFLGEIKRGWFVHSRKTCLKWCVNPVHLTVKPNNRYKPSSYEPVLSKPPAFVIGEGPGPLYVQDRRVLPALLNEEDLPPKKVVNRPGFAGAHPPDPPPADEEPPTWLTESEE